MKLMDCLEGCVENCVDPILIKNWKELEDEEFGKYEVFVDENELSVYDNELGCKVARLSFKQQEYLISLALMVYGINVIKDKMFEKWEEEEGFEG